MSADISTVPPFCADLVILPWFIPTAVQYVDPSSNSFAPLLLDELDRLELLDDFDSLELELETLAAVELLDSDSPDDDDEDDALLTRISLELLLRWSSGCTVKSVGYDV